MTTVRLINTTITSHSYFDCCFVVKMLKFYSLSKLQVHKTVLLIIVNMMYVKFLELIHLISEGLYTLIVSPL